MSTHHIDIQFQLNGRPQRHHVDVRDNAIDVLNRCGLKGARESCGQGLCGCCTIYVDGQPASGCLCPAWKLEGRDVQTVEAAHEQDGELDPIQQAFIDTGAFQCGFCTPGFVMMTRKLLDLHPSPTNAQIEHYLAGNLCRCGTYPEIIAAVRLAAERIASAR
ncbi:Nicotinate dehydrogenase small FeS subunit [Pigmentiphaga humi]|uniref:Nicotinate dehydrogenase small FeS subunit n=1 Tax=Pigmentiphaga humi TaxID=2478468 RepID=A0A3P4B3Q7_9BURK|nr:(2Fe-2S)-binding protein [Pigmentiphaga humi]VCU70933.1 Nicotinate dehydrogenase small FeS subunit [Pigmentiphaga humi]